GPGPNVGPGLGRGPPGDGLDAPARRLPVQAAPPAAEAGAAGRLDDDVADVAGVAGPPVEQAPVEHDPTADSRRDNHPDVGPYPGGGSNPPLGQGDGLGVVVDEDGKAGG